MPSIFRSRNRAAQASNAGDANSIGLENGQGFDYPDARSRSVTGEPPDSPDLQDGSSHDYAIQYGRPGLKQFGGFVYEEYLPELTGKRGIDTFRKMSESDPIIWAIMYSLEMLIRKVSFTIEVSDKAQKTRAAKIKKQAQVHQDKLQAHKQKTAQAIASGALPDDPPHLDDGDDLTNDSAETAREFVEECFSDMEVTWQDTLSEILTFLTYGWSWLEVLYKERRGPNPDDPTKDSQYDDGKIAWRKFAPRAQDTMFRWSYNDDGDLTGLYQIPPPDFQTHWVPRNKSLHFRTLQHKDNPEGRSILRGAYRSWYFKQHIETIEAIGIERDLAGMPVVYAPPEYFSPNATPDQKALMGQLKDLAIKTKKDEQMGVVFPLAYKDGQKLFEFELLKTGGSRQIDTNAIVQRYDNRIAMTLLADFIMLGHENSGSWALASSKTDMFKVAMGAWLDVICTEINRHAITPLCDLNGIAIEDRPKLVHGDVSNADLAELGAYIQALSAAGMPIFPNQPLTDFLLETAGLPKPGPDDQMKVAQQQQEAQDGVDQLRNQAAMMQSQQGQDPTKGGAQAPAAKGQGIKSPANQPEPNGQPTVNGAGQQQLKPSGSSPAEKGGDKARPRPS